jgi:hypothetical protein
MMARSWRADGRSLQQANGPEALLILGYYIGAIPGFERPTMRKREGDRRGIICDDTRKRITGLLYSRYFVTRRIPHRTTVAALTTIVVLRRYACQKYDHRSECSQRRIDLA